MVTFVCATKETTCLLVLLVKVTGQKQRQPMHSIRAGGVQAHILPDGDTEKGFCLHGLPHSSQGCHPMDSSWVTMTVLNLLIKNTILVFASVKNNSAFSFIYSYLYPLDFLICKKAQ